MAADLRKRRVLPEPVQRGGEPVREHLLAQLLEGACTESPCNYCALHIALPQPSKSLQPDRSLIRCMPCAGQLLFNVADTAHVALRLGFLCCGQFADVTALGSPEAAADRLLKQTLDEFMSTRLGSRKQAEIVSASRRDADGRAFYDIEVRLLVRRYLFGPNALSMLLTATWSAADIGTVLERLTGELCMACCVVVHVHLIHMITMRMVGETCHLPSGYCAGCKQWVMCSKGGRIEGREIC